MTTTLTVYPNGRLVAGVQTFLTVYAQDGVTLITQAGAIAPYTQYYTDLIAQAQLVTTPAFPPVGDPVSLLVAPLTVVGTPTIGDTLVFDGDNTVEWDEAPTGATTDGVLVSELSALAITLLNDGAVRFCDGGTAQDDGKGGMFYAKYGDASTAVAGENVAATGGRWKRVQSNNKRLLVTDLMSRVPAYDNEIVFCSGYYLDINQATGTYGFGDNGGGWFKASTSGPAATATIDGGMVIGPSTIAAGSTHATAGFYPDQAGGAIIPTPGGAAWRYHRMTGNTSFRSVKWFGALANNDATWSLPTYAVSDTNAVFSAITSARPVGAQIHFTEGNYAIRQTVGCGPSQSYMRFTCDRQATTLRWYGYPYWAGAAPVAAANGVTGSVMLKLDGPSCIVEDLQFAVAAGYHCEVLVNLGVMENETPLLSQTGHTMNRCTAQGNSKLIAGGTAGYFVVWDYFGKLSGNLENITFNDCGTAKFLHAAYLTTVTTQPYNITWNGCHISGFLHSSANSPWGIGWRNQAISCTALFIGCDYQRTAVPFYLEYPPYAVKCQGGGGEQYKKIFYGHTGTSQSHECLSIDSMRWSIGGCDEASEGDLVFSAVDERGIEIGGSGGLLITSTVLNDAFAEFPNWRCKVGSNDVTIIGSSLPNLTPVERVNFTKKGRTRLIGNQGFAAAAVDFSNVADTFGCESWGGTFTALAGTTTTTVTLARSEAIAATDYLVDFQVQSVSAGAAVRGSVFATSPTITQFTANHPDPGGATSVVYRFKLSRI